MKNGPLDRALLVAIVMLSAAALVGCSSSSDGQAEKAPAASTASGTPSEEAGAGASADGSPTADACSSVSAPLVDIDPLSDEEPRLHVPQPPGWEPNTTLNTDLIRYALANQGLVADSFVPNVVVTLERVSGTDVEPQAILDQQRAGLETQALVTDMSVSPTTMCGALAEIVDYTLPAQGAAPAHPAKVLITAAPVNGDTYSATVTVQAMNADDPTYQQDAETILNGFQMLPPTP